MDFGIDVAKESSEMVLTENVIQAESAACHPN
jgi:hypothetical protein